MDKSTAYLFTHFGLGNAPEDLALNLANKFLQLTLQSGQIPGRILFYTEGVKLACEGSPVLDVLAQYEQAGVELVLCSTCLDYFGFSDRVKVGVVGGMGDIIEALQKAAKVITL